MRLEAGTKVDIHLDIECVALAHLEQVLAGIKLTTEQLSSKLLELSREVAKGSAENQCQKTMPIHMIY